MVYLFAFITQANKSSGESHSALILLYRAVELPTKAEIEAQEKAAAAN